MPVCEWPTLTGSNSPPSKNLTARSCQGCVDNGSAQPWSASSLPEAQPTLKGLAGYRLVRTTIKLQRLPHAPSLEACGRTKQGSPWCGQAALPTKAKETWPSLRAPSHISCWAHRREDNLKGNLRATMLQITLITVTVQGGLQSERMRWWIRSQLSVYVSIFPKSVSEPKQDWI